MNFSKFLGALFGLFAFSWLGLVVVPYYQLSDLRAQLNEETGDVYPIDAGGMVAAGRVVYAENGCITCHTQQLRPGFVSADMQRKWGTRQTVARDYIYETPALLGTMRIGPDLSSVGRRRMDAQWHHQHLYNPRSVVPDSIMPSFRHLYQKRKIVGQRSMFSVGLDPKDTPEQGYEIVPRPEAQALVTYLLSLDRTHPLPEAAQEGTIDEPEQETTPPAEAAAPAAAAAAGDPKIHPPDANAAPQPVPGVVQ